MSAAIIFFTGEALRSSENEDLAMTPPICPATLCLKLGRMVSNVLLRFPSQTPDAARLPKLSLSVFPADGLETEGSGGFGEERSDFRIRFAPSLGPASLPKMTVETR